MNKAYLLFIFTIIEKGFPFTESIFNMKKSSDKNRCSNPFIVNEMFIYHPTIYVRLCKNDDNIYSVNRLPISSLSCVSAAAVACDAPFNS